MWHLLRHAQTNFRFINRLDHSRVSCILFVDISGTLSELFDGISDANVTSYRLTMEKIWIVEIDTAEIRWLSQIFRVI